MPWFCCMDRGALQSGSALKSNGGLVAIAVFAATGLTMYLAYLASPSSLWLMMATAIFLVSRNSANPLVKALAKTTFPFLWGLGAVAALQIYFHFYGVQTTRLHALEATLLELKDEVPAWTDFAWWQFCGIIFLLLAMHLAIPRFSPVKRFLWTTKLLGNIGAVLATMACFTFFGHQAAVQPLGVAQGKLVAEIAEARDKNWRDSVHVLATEAMAQELTRMDAPAQAALLKNAVLLARWPSAAGTMPPEVDSRIADAFRTRLYEQLPMLQLSIDAPPTESRPATTAELFAQRTAEQQRKNELRHEQDKARAALEAVVSRLINGLTDAPANLVKALISNLLEGDSSFLAEHVTAFASKTASAFFDKLRKPLIDKIVDIGMRRWQIFGSKPASEMMATEVSSQARDMSLKEAGRWVSFALRANSPVMLDYARREIQIAVNLALASAIRAAQLESQFQAEVEQALTQVEQTRRQIQLNQAADAERQEAGKRTDRFADRAKDAVERPIIRGR
jgi:hypothetical protein